MKIRIQSDSIRFRLTQHEVNELTQGMAVHSKIRFSILDELEFTIQPWLLNVTEVKLDHHKILVSVPQPSLTEWAETDQEGIMAGIDNGSSEGLRITIDKDYECIGRDNENAGLFPNPKSKC